MQKKTPSLFFRVFSITFLALFSLLAIPAFAQTPPSGTFVVRPAKVEVSLSPGETKTVLLNLTNGTPIPLRVETSFEDIDAGVQMTPSDDPIRLLGDTTGAHSLKKYLSVSRNSFDLLSAKEVIVPVEIHIPENTLPGGRYGSAVFSVSPAINPGEEDQANVSVLSRVGVSIYVRILGSVKEEGKLVAFGLFNESKVVSSPTEETPLRFQVAFENTGDVYLNPHGVITIKGMFGREEKVEIDPYAVLPQATRMREIDLLTPLSMGFYSAQLSLSRGYGDVLESQTVKFFVIPTMPMILAFLIILIVGSLMIYRSLRISKHIVS